MLTRGQFIKFGITGNPQWPDPGVFENNFPALESPFASPPVAAA
jgi:hypothetical protein